MTIHDKAREAFQDHSQVLGVPGITPSRFPLQSSSQSLGRISASIAHAIDREPLLLTLARMHARPFPTIGGSTREHEVQQVEQALREKVQWFRHRRILAELAQRYHDKRMAEDRSPAPPWNDMAGAHPAEGEVPHRLRARKGDLEQPGTLGATAATRHAHVQRAKGTVQMRAA